MGNIVSLHRNGWQNTSNYADLDVLNYNYDSGNKLLSVTDLGNKTYGFKDRNFTGNDYSYDPNGNLIEDKNKGITSVDYNHFNFPTSIVVSNPEHNGSVQYTYDANGVKLKKTATDNGGETTMEYNGDYVYENGVLKSITHPEGYIEKENDGRFTYIYEYRDIWGNTRITYADNDRDGKIDLVQNGVDTDGDGDLHEEIRREQLYYPFGMPWEGINAMIRGGVKNNLKTYQGQELTEDLDLDIHEWRYRMSDRSIGRFWQIDPLSEEYVYNSTYAFQENKMGMGVELEGLELGGFPDPFESNIGGQQAENRLMAQISSEAMAIASEVGSMIDNLFAKGSVTVSKESNSSSNPNDSSSTAVETTYTAEAGPNLESFFSNYNVNQDGTVEFNSTPMITETDTQVTATTTAKLAAKVTPVADITMTGQSKTNLNNNETTLTGRATLGRGDNGLFVSGSSNTTTGSTKIEGGLRVGAKTPKINGFGLSANATFGVRVMIDENN